MGVANHHDWRVFHRVATRRTLEFIGGNEDPGLWKSRHNSVLVPDLEFEVGVGFRAGGA